MWRNRLAWLLTLVLVIISVTGGVRAEQPLIQVHRPDGVGLTVTNLDANELRPVHGNDLFWMLTSAFNGMAEPKGSTSTIVVVQGGKVAEVYTGNISDLPTVPGAPDDGYVLIGSGLYHSFIRNLKVGDEVRTEEKARTVQLQNPNMVITEDGAVHPITEFNKGRGSDQMIIYTPDFGTHSISNQFGTEAAVVDGEVVAIRPAQSTQPYPIPQDGYLLSGHGSANSWLSNNVRVGTKVELGRGSVLGMQMTEPEFFAALDLTYPGLEEVQAAVQVGNWADARSAFAEYLRSRTGPTWYFDRHDPLKGVTVDGQDILVANDALRNRFSIGNVGHTFTDGIDWSFNPTTQPNVSGAATDEWTWGLNRHTFWPRMGRTYHLLKDERYAQAFVEQMTDWVAKNPVPLWAQQGAFSRWRTIEAGLRMQNSWPNAFLYFLSSPSFTDEAIVTMVKSMVEHARYLATHNTGGNWLTIEMNGLYHVGVLFPELKEAAEWRRFAAERMRDELTRQVYPDGAQNELAPQYHITAVENFLGIADIANMNGYELPTGYLENLERMFDYSVYMLQPNGRMPDFNDSADANPRDILWRGHQLFPERQDFLWVALGRTVGEPPEQTSVALPYAGHLIQRSGWDANARYLAFDVGPFGNGHQHEDKLNFVLSAYGRDFVVDAGKYVYDNSKWREYVRSPYGHNIAFVDGLGQNRRMSLTTFVSDEPSPHVWQVTPEYEFAQGYYGSEIEGYGAVPRWIATHQRSILYVKEGVDQDFWVIADTFFPQDASSHRYETLFHLNAAEVAVGEESAVRTLFSSGANLGIFPLSDGVIELANVVKGQEEPFVQGWMYVVGRGAQPIPTATYVVEGPGVQRMLYVLYPVSQGTVPSVSVAPWDTGQAREDGVGAEITFADGRVYRIYFPAQVGETVTFEKGASLHG